MQVQLLDPADHPVRPSERRTVHQRSSDAPSATPAVDPSSVRRVKGRPPGTTDETGLTAVTNGVNLCEIHDAAYDRNLLGIEADYRVAINRQLLDEVDGPVLSHGLQEMHGTTIQLPGRAVEHPDRDRLSARFALFRAS